MFWKPLVPAENCAADIKLHQSDEIAVAAEYALGHPIRKVNVLSKVLATFRRKIGWRWLLDRIDWFAENCKIGRIWVDVGRDH